MNARATVDQADREYTQDELLWLDKDVIHDRNLLAYTEATWRRQIRQQAIAQGADPETANKFATVITARSHPRKTTALLRLEAGRALFRGCGHSRLSGGISLETPACIEQNKLWQLPDMRARGRRRGWQSSRTGTGSGYAMAHGLPRPRDHEHAQLYWWRRFLYHDAKLIQVQLPRFIRPSPEQCATLRRNPDLHLAILKGLRRRVHWPTRATPECPLPPSMGAPCAISRTALATTKSVGRCASWSRPD